MVYWPSYFDFSRDFDARGHRPKTSPSRVIFYSSPHFQRVWLLTVRFAKYRVAEHLESEIWPWPKFFLLPSFFFKEVKYWNENPFCFCSKNKSSFCIRSVYLVEWESFVFFSQLHQGKKKFDEVALFHSWFLRFIYFFKKGGEGMDEREEQILTDVYLVDFGHNTICKNYDNLFFSIQK